ncbi:MAG: hypothetical protein WCV67_15730 [Victivallaceae bacterium]|jgi:hypothetical protein
MTRKKSVNLMLVLSAFCILFCSGALMAESSFTVSPGLSVEFKKFDSQYFIFMDHFKQMDAVVSRLIKSNRGRGIINCRILITPDAKEKTTLLQTNELVTISLSNDYEKWKNDFHINKYLLSTIILCRLGIKPEENFNALPQWMLAGMLGMFHQRYTTAIIFDTYYMPGLKACALEGKIPELRKVISQPLYQESDGTAYEFYEEVCSFLVKKIESISSGSEHILNDIIFLSVQKKYSPQEIFSTTVERVVLEKYFKNSSPNDSDEKKIQFWFESVAREKSLSALTPFSAKQIREKIAAIRKVTCMMKNGKKESKEETIDITELPEKLSLIENKNAVLLEKINIIESVRNACPLALAETAFDFNQALSDIGTKSESKSREQLITALDNLNKELDKQEAIEDYLFKLENTKLSPALLYSREINEAGRKDYTMWPSLNKYLDSVEKKFLED